MASSREKTMSNFFHSCLVTQEKLTKGTYTIVVDVDWHESADMDAEYKRVLVRVFTGEKFVIQEID